MARWFRPFLLATVVSSVSLVASAPAGITLIGTGFISGMATDKSGLDGVTCQAGSPQNCVPNAIFGGFGSALAYTGHDNVFIAAPDRGPFDGLTDAPFADRVHLLHMTTDIGASFPNIRTHLLDTRLLKNEQGQQFVGAANAFVAGDDLATRRLDPEGIQVGSVGHLLYLRRVRSLHHGVRPPGQPGATHRCPGQVQDRQPERRPDGRTDEQHCRAPGKQGHGGTRDHLRTAAPCSG